MVNAYWTIHIFDVMLVCTQMVFKHIMVNVSSKQSIKQARRQMSPLTHMVGTAKACPNTYLKYKYKSNGVLTDVFIIVN